MDGKKNPPNIKSQNDLQEIENLMGKRFQKVDLVGQSPHNPQKQNLPKRPEPPKEVQGGIKPIFPLVPDDQVHLYKETTRKPEEIFGNNQHGKIDPELNELALREVAESRGVTVEELLAQNPDKKLEKKLEFADMSEDKEPTEKQMSIEQAKQMVADEVNRVVDSNYIGEFDDPELLDLELKKVELERKLAEIRKQKQFQQQQAQKPAQQKKPNKAPLKKKKPKIEAKKVHPLLKELRQKFSLDEIKIKEIEVDGLSFGLLPAPASLQAWVFEKLSAASMINSEQAMRVAVRAVVVASSLVTINGEPLVEVLGLMEGPKTKKFLDIEHRELLAQAIWEMITGTQSIEGLFTFDPHLVVHLYECYEKEFPERKFRSNQDEVLHRFVCPEASCEEIYEQEIPSTGVVFCKVHAIPMEDVGNLEEINQLPLA